MSTAVTLTEGLSISVTSRSLVDARNASLASQLEQVTASTICEDAQVCNVSATVVTMEGELDENSGRRLQAANSISPGIMSPTLPPSPHEPPALPPLSPIPPMYWDRITIATRRILPATAAYMQQLQTPNHTLEAAWWAAFESSPMHTTHIISHPRAALTELSARVQLSHAASNAATVNMVAVDLFTLLLNASGVMADLSASLGLERDAFVLNGVSASYTHPEDGLVNIQSALPPPPPTRPSAEPEDLASGDNEEQLLLSDSVENVPPMTIKAAAETVTAVVAGAVATAVAGAVASAVAGAVGGSVGGAVGGAAGGGAAGGGAAGGAAGGIFPLVLGAQRLSLSAGLAVPKGAIDSGVASGMGWATGDLGIFGSASPPAVNEEGSGNDEAAEGSERRLSKEMESVDLVFSKGGDIADEDTLPTAFYGLTNRIGINGIVISSVTLLHLCFLLFWKYRINRKFYADGTVTIRLGKSFSIRKLYRKRKHNEVTPEDSTVVTKSGIKFRALPGVFVFPCLQLVCIKLLGTGCAP